MRVRLHGRPSRLEGRGGLSLSSEGNCEPSSGAREASWASPRALLASSTLPSLRNRRASASFGSASRGACAAAFCRILMASSSLPLASWASALAITSSSFLSPHANGTTDTHNVSTARAGKIRIFTSETECTHLAVVVVVLGLRPAVLADAWPPHGERIRLLEFVARGDGTTSVRDPGPGTGPLQAGAEDLSAGAGRTPPMYRFCTGSLREALSRGTGARVPTPWLFCLA